MMLVVYTPPRCKVNLLEPFLKKMQKKKIPKLKGYFKFAVLSQ